MKLTRLFKEFYDSEKAGGIILIFVTIFSLLLANSPWKEGYINFWNIKFEHHSLVHWINDGLMTFFFLLIGLELERELYRGELSDIKNALFPVFGAVGGMLVPAAIYFTFNAGKAGSAGAGIPMATDIAFAIGILSLLGKRVPSSLKIFLTAFAIVDDLGAIFIIALFYTSGISVINLLIALVIFIILIVLNRLKVFHLAPYLAGGIIMWYFMLHSGIHPTIAGILLAFAVPFGKENGKSPSAFVEHILEKPVAFIILPLFAIANTCIILNGHWQTGLMHEISLGILLGLVIGKPAGIWAFSRIAVGLKLCKLPQDLKWNNIFMAGILGGIGFTMSIFISLLAFQDPAFVNIAKIAILAASIIAGSSGFILLKITLKNNIQENDNGS